MRVADSGIIRVGVDTGGTFTDIAWVEHGRLRIAKVPSKPDSPALAVMDGLALVPSVPRLVSHGTTVGTNAVLARHGGPARMVVTKGFRDVLLIGRGERENPYSPDPARPKPLFQKDEIYEIDLRLDHLGNILESPNEDEIEKLALSIQRDGARAVAVGILHSAQYPAEEAKLAATLSALTGLPAFASSSIAAYPREYERWTAASLAAYLAPVLGAYIGDLTRRCPAKLALMASSGGLVSPSQALDNPAICMLSGPAGGAIAALSLGIDRVLALDMGGTSTDVSLLTGSIPKTRGTVVDGLPVPLPTVDIHTIGAGGGSIVKFDRGGMLALGPESAGADPGPASYGKGGPATLTDTALLAGRVAPGRFLGGKMPLDPSASSRALESIRPPQLKFDDMLDGIMELARVHLTGALRRISVARGIDPSAPQSLFTLVPFGGAGALFAVECARKMGLKEVFHPRAAGAFSALGLVAAPIAAERERVILRPIGSSLEQLLITQTDLTSELNRELSKWGETGEPLFRATVECRYVGQTHTLDIPLPDPLSADTLRKAFEAAYKARYTYLHSGVDIEIVALRVRGEIPPPEVDFPELDNIGRDITIAKTGATRIRSDGRWVDAPIYYRDRLPIETEIIGPALIIEDFATLYLPSGSSMHLNDKGHARIEVG